MGGGGGVKKIVCVHAHHECKAEVPYGRGPEPMGPETLGLF